MKERHREPTKLLLLPGGEVSTHPTDPVEMRRLHYQTPGTYARYQGCSTKKEVGGRLKQDLDKDFLNNLGLHTRTLIGLRVRKISSPIQLLVFECL